MSREVPYYEYDSNHLRVARIHSAFSFPAHLHAQVELTCCLAGQIQVDIGAQAYTLAQGDIAIIFPSVAHRYAAVQGQAAVGTMLIFYPAFIPDFSRLFAQRTPTCPVVRAAQCAGDAAYALAALHQELEAGGDDVAIRALTTLLLCRTLPHTRLEAAQGAPAHDTLHRAMQYLSERFTGPITLSQTAHDIGVSPYHLSRQFSSRLGTGFCAYINALRLNQAELYLKNTDMPITEIVYATGFESQRTFNRAFLQAYGMPPREMRRGLGQATAGGTAAMR